MKIFAAVLFVGLLVGAAIHGNATASAQQRLAESWSGDAAQFSATGLTGSTLRIALPEESQVECEAMVDSIKTDSKLAVELRQANFRTVECGQVRGELR